MANYDDWIKRIEIDLEVQKDLCLEVIDVRLNRRELIELLQMVKTLKDLEDKYGKD